MRPIFLDRRCEPARLLSEGRVLRRYPGHSHRFGRHRNREGATAEIGRRANYQCESETERLQEAVVAFREALKERTRDRVPLDWAATQKQPRERAI